MIKLTVNEINEFSKKTQYYNENCRRTLFRS